MRAVFILAWKDLRGLLSTPMFYVVTTCCTILWSIVFIAKFSQFAIGFRPGVEGQHNIHNEVFIPHISGINLVFLVVIPAITMRLLSEEKKQRTFDLLLTSPITALQIAIGKFFAGFGAALLLTFISFIYPLIAGTMAEFPWGPLLTTYAGLVLMSGMYVSIGLFASSLTESAVLSVIMGLIFNLILWFISMTAEQSSGGSLAAILEYLSVGQHFISFVGGAIKMNAVVFMLSCIGLFIFLTQRVIESARWR